MHQFSDSDTPDSDEGIRFKTDSTRNKESNHKTLQTPRDRRRLTKSRSRSLERRRNRRIDDRDRNVRGRSRERSKYRRRSLSREKRSNSRNRKLRRSRERRSYSKERRVRQKSKDRNTKYDRSPSRNEKDQRNKRSASTEVKIDINKRKKDSDNPKRDSKNDRDTKKSKSKDRDVRNSPSISCIKDKDKDISSAKSIKEQTDLCLELAEAMNNALDSSNDDIIVFGPALPPKLLTNNSEKSNSASPKRQCKHKKSKKHLKEPSNAVLEDVVSEHRVDGVPCKRTDVRAFSKVSTSPISSEDNNSASEDGFGDAETYGPVLSKVGVTDDKFVIEIEDSDVEPENNSYGPKINETNVHNSSRNAYYGPDIALREPEDAIPYVETPCQSVGPFLPEHLRERLLANAEKNGNANISLSDEEIEEGEIVGPILPGSTASFSASQIALEERALQYKLDRLSSSNSGADIHAREDWMLSLPEAGGAAKMGLGPRQFRARAGPDMSDRSGWTDTPKDKEAKQRCIKSTKEDNAANLKVESERLEIEERDKEQERMARKHHKKHRKKDKKDKSLLEMHHDKLKMKNKNEDDGEIVRRPFNRDIDLKVNQFDDAQKKAIYKKAQLLDDRFSKGESKYL